MLRIDHLALNLYLGAEGVAMSFAQAVRPPQFRFCDCERYNRLVLARFEGCRAFGKYLTRLFVNNTKLCRSLFLRENFELYINICTLCGNALLVVEYIAYAHCIPRFEIYRSPNSRCNESWSPIPTVVVARFTTEYADFAIEQTSVSRLVLPTIVLEWQSLPLRHINLYNRVEIYSQLVLAFLEERFNIHTPTTEHIVRFEHQLVVEIDISVGVQALENELNALFR